MACPISTVVLPGIWCQACGKWTVQVDESLFPSMCLNCRYLIKEASYTPEGYYFQEDADGGRLIKKEG